MKQVKEDLKVVNAVQKEKELERSFVVINLDNVDKEYLEETRELFSSFYKRTLTDEECIEIINNMLNPKLLLRRIQISKQEVVR